MNLSQGTWIGIVILGVLFCCLPASGQQGMTNGEWLAYGADKGSTKYSSLDQINRDTIKDLDIAWTWDSPDNPIADAHPRVIPFIYEVTPIVVDGVMYVSTSLSQVAAINPVTGETIWVFDTKSWEDGRPTNLGYVHRGVAYWSDGKSARIFIGTGNAHLWALDARTGTPIESFGDGGRVDIKKGLRRPTQHRNYQISSPPIICRGVVVVGSSIFDGPTMKEMPPGDVNAFDVRTGEPAWTFHNPPMAGEPGYETWKEGAADYTGNANVWTGMTADEENGLIYLPFGTPTNDWYGGHRKGDGLYAESIVCVKADTGERVWHFQTTHHGVWDYDLCAAPTLLDIKVDGKKIPALAQVSKQGFLYVFNRLTGEPVWPIHETPVGVSTADGEETSPTQPIPTKPAAFEWQGASPEMLIDFTPEIKAEALKILEKYNYGPLYTPPMEGKATIYNPGWGGGANWMGCAADPETGMVYVPSQTGPIAMELTRPDASRSNFRLMGKNSGGVKGPFGLPLFKPPYGRVTAIDLNTGEHAWQIPIGEGPRNHPKLKDLDLPALGDASRGHPLVTKSMLLIAQGGFGGRGSSGSGGEEKPNLHFIDKKTGEIFGTFRLPKSPSATPMTYSIDGKQYIAVAVGGTRHPAQIIALALTK